MKNRIRRCKWQFILLYNSLITHQGPPRYDKGNRNHAWRRFLRVSFFFRLRFNVFLFWLRSHTISKHFEFYQKYSATHHIFNFLMSVWKSDETLYIVFDTVQLWHWIIIPPSCSLKNTLPESITGSHVVQKLHFVALKLLEALLETAVKYQSSQFIPWPITGFYFI